MKKNVIALVCVLMAFATASAQIMKKNTPPRETRDNCKSPKQRGFHR